MGIAEDMKRLRDDIEQARHRRQQDATTRRQEIAQLSRETQQIRREAREELQANSRWMVELQREHLLEVGHRVQEVRQQCRSMLDDFRHSFQDASKTRAEARRHALRQHEEFFNTLQSEVDELRSHIRQDLQREREQGRQQRKASLQQTSDEVQAIRRDIADLLGDYRQELDTLHQLWTNASSTDTAPSDVEPPTPPQDSPKKSTATPPELPEPPSSADPRPAPEAKPAPPQASPKAPEQLAEHPRESQQGPRNPDDLEEIIGIGPSTKKVLYEAGLFYFKDLATMSPEAVTDMLGELAKFANVEYWIEQAQQLVDSNPAAHPASAS